MNGKKKIVNWEEMDDKQMNTLLLELADTSYYQAMLRFIAIRLDVADNGLRSIDPFKKPTEMSRTQGVRAGLQDLQLYIDDLVEEASGEGDENR